jgi:hypothetical protein
MPMIWWTPTKRGEPFQWMSGKVWKHVEMSLAAARAIYGCICIIPMLFEAANDRDGATYDRVR